MAERFLKVHLSKDARDFQHVAIKDVPILDPTNANDRKLRKALGRFAAQAEYTGNHVDFFLVDEDGARPHGLSCEPVSERDLKSDRDLQKEFVELERRLQLVEVSELRDGLLKSFQESRTSNTRPSPFFFKYRGADRKQRLVWCWGYQRKETEPGDATICSSSGCRSLFIKRENAPVCPVCKARPEPVPPAAPKSGPRLWPRFVAGLATAAALILAVTYFFLPRPAEQPVAPKYVISPGVEWKGPAGGRIEYAIKRVSADGKEENLTDQAIPRSDNPKVLRFERGRLTAQARSPGKSVVTFHVGPVTLQATVEVVPPTKPDRIYFEPDKVTLGGIGSTARLKVFGEYQGGKKVESVDLSDVIEWVPVRDGVIFAHRGVVEGLAVGKSEVKATYPGSGKSPQDPLSATATVEVEGNKTITDFQFALARSQLAVGESAIFTATVKPETGEPFSVADSSQLEFRVDPPQLAKREHDVVTALEAGNGKIHAKFRGKEAFVDLVVTTAATTPEAKRDELAGLVVGETAPIENSAASRPSITSTNPEIAEIVDGTVVARSPGNTTIHIEQDGKTKTVEVEVRREKFRGIAIRPARITLAVDETQSPEVVGILSNGEEVTLSPDQLTIERLPGPAFVDFDPQSLSMRGLQATNDQRQKLVVRHEENRAELQIDVIVAPARIEVLPAGPLTVPAKQAVRLKAYASYADGQRTELQPDKFEWQTDPEQPSESWKFDRRTGVADAVKESDEKLTVSAVYQGRTSEPVQLSIAPPKPMDLALKIPQSLVVGETGRLQAQWADPAQSAAPERVEFSSSSPKLLIIDEQTGEFAAIAAGKVRVAAQHSAAAKPASGEITITNPVIAKLEPPELKKPEKVQITSGQGESVKIGLNTEYSEVKVEAIDGGGKAFDVTSQSLLTVEDPATAPVSISGNRLKAFRIGKTAITATYNNVRSNALPVEVADVLITEIRIEPKNPIVQVGQATVVRVIAFTGTGDSKPSLGDISSRADLEFAATPNDILDVAGQSITGIKKGNAELSVKLGSARAVADVTVVPAPGEEGSSVPIAPLVGPESLNLRVGESKNTGTDLDGMQSGGEIPPDAALVSSDPDVLRVDPATSSLVGVSPGEATLAITHNGRTQEVPVTVSPAEVTNGRLVLEPANGTITQGEALELRVFLIDESGKRHDRTGSSSIQSSDDKIIAVKGSKLVGQSAGNAVITASIAESDKPATAEFTVAEQDFTAIEIAPSQVKMNAGDTVSLSITGVGPGGRRKLTEHDDLKVEVKGDNPKALQVVGHQVRGVVAGVASLEVRWGDIAAEPVSVTVTDEAWSDLRISPSDAKISEGEDQAYLVYAKRSGKERAVTVADGVRLQIDNPSLAASDQGLVVRGISPGVATVTVRLDKLRADAKLTIDARSRIHKLQPSESPPFTHLRFIPDTLRLQLGTNGARARVVKVTSNGRQEDADHRTVMSFKGPDDVVSMIWTASGPMFKPLKTGFTQVTAVDEGLSTEKMLTIEVVDAPSLARLEVLPDPFTLEVGETKEFQRVRLLAGPGLAPTDVRYEITSDDPKIVVVQDRRALRGIAAGNTTVTVKPLDVDKRFGELQHRISVRVTPAAVDQEKTDVLELVLSGPDRTTVGAETKYSITLDGRDVTRDGASLVLNRDEAVVADALPGGILIGKRAASVSIKAHYKDAISNSLTVRIEEIAKQFSRLDLEVEARPLVLGESRVYKLWGYPSDGGTRQDLTASIGKGGDAAARLTIDPSSGVIQNRPPELVAQAPGEVKIWASIGGAGDRAVTSSPIHLKVVNEDTANDIIAVDPPAISVRLGQSAPPVRVLARRLGEVTPRQVDAKFEPENPAMLERAARGFIGKLVGKTKLLAKVGDQQLSVDVTVNGNPFAEVAYVEKPLGNGQFSVVVSITGNVAEPTQYRIIEEQGDEGGPWTETVPSGGSVTTKLTSPVLGIVNLGQQYHLIVESRPSGSSGKPERYPLTFSIGITRSNNR